MHSYANTSSECDDVWGNYRPSNRKFWRGAKIASFDQVKEAITNLRWIFTRNGRPTHPQWYQNMSICRLMASIDRGELRFAIRNPAYPYVWKAHFHESDSFYRPGGWAECSEIRGSVCTPERPSTRKELENLCVEATVRAHGPEAKTVIEYAGSIVYCYAQPKMRPTFQEAISGRSRKELCESARLLGVPSGTTRADVIRNLQAQAPGVIALYASFIK